MWGAKVLGGVEARWIFGRGGEGGRNIADGWLSLKKADYEKCFLFIVDGGVFSGGCPAGGGAG